MANGKKSLCDGCKGACCRGVAIQVGNMTVDQLAWMNTRGEAHMTPTGGMWRIRSRCEHLSWRGRCRIYATRPEVCREFAPGSGRCRAAREFFGVK